MNEKSKILLCIEGAKKERAMISEAKADTLKAFINPDEVNKEHAKALAKNVNQLSDAEKKAAFINATIAKASEK